MRITLLCCLFLLAFPAHALTVAAASSLRLVMPELEQAFTAHHPKASVRVIFGASGKLATQILNGAPYDVFLSADDVYPQRLVDEGAAVHPPVNYASGRLVLWHKDPALGPLQPEALASDQIRRIAIAQPRHAPYGQRAAEALKALGLWQQVEPRLVYGENIGQTTAMVESGAADAGLIAWSLTFAPELADRPFTLIDRELHRPLDMAMVITAGGQDEPDARVFYDFMLSDEARSILMQYGFEPPAEP